MTIRHKRSHRQSMTLGLLITVAGLLSSCGGGDGGIIGTGMTIEGTVPTNRAFASNNVNLKAISGERETATIDNNGRFSATSLAGNGPYLMKVDLGNNNAYYTIAHTDGGNIIQNIHGYSDVAIRNWFATRGLDIDAAFDSNDALAQLPTALEISEINQVIRNQIQLALQSYGLGSTDLQSVVFNADNTGVDEFLDQNPILLSNVNGNVSITINISDPASGTQSTVTQGLPINTDLTAADVEPPSAPSALRVLPSASDEIVLAWNAAGDNIGVTEYEISRDGEVIGTAPYPVYVDSPLQAGVNYTYVITALDAAGNRSLASVSGSSSTLNTPDTTSPPSPSGLQLTPNTTSMDVRWVQSEIADVASFRVLRATDDSMLDTLVRVTSTQLIDGGLNSGTNYCYQIIAIDASENASDPSERVCAFTGGSVVSGGNTTPPAPDNTSDNSHLATLDAASLACTEALDVDALSGQAQVTAGCYLVNENISLDETSLTLDAGVILKFASRTGIRISQDSSLSINGTRQNPVVLTGQQPTDGFWNGLEYVFSNNIRNTLNHTLIEYGGAGGDNNAALHSNTTAGLAGRLALQNVLIRHSASYGFLFDAGTVIDQFDTVTSTENLQPGLVTPQIAGLFGSGLSFSGNTEDTLDLSNDDIERAMTLPRLDVPYSADRLDIVAPLNIADGVSVVFDAGGAVRVDQDGSLRVSGTAANPVLLTGAQPTPGYWQGVEFVFSNNINNDLQHLIIEYGGSGTGQAGNLTTNSTEGLPVRLKLGAVTLRHSASTGFDFREGTTLSQFDNVVSTLNEESGSVYPTTLASFGTGVDLMGNTFDRVTLLDGDVDSVQTWPTLNVPVRFNRLSIESALTLSPGLDMVGAAGAEVRVDQTGSLSAIGTAAAPIVFRGEQGTPGFWAGLRYVFSNSALNVMDHVMISDGGSGAPTDNGNIDLECPSAGLPGVLTISNAFISNSNGWGILADGNGCTVNVGVSVTYSNNREGDILQ